jgi:hypothetical protein
MEQYEGPRTTADSAAEGRMKDDVTTKKSIIKKCMKRKKPR